MLEILLSVSLVSFYLRRQIGGEWCGFMCCGVADTLWCYLVLSWFKFCCCHVIIHHSSAAHKSHFGTGFYGYFTVFLLKGLCRKLVLCALVSCWYTCLVYAQKFKNNNTNKQGICLHQIGGDCWTRCVDVSKSKRKAWRPCCWVCVCCLVVWNLLIHSLRWSKFIWIFNLLKICVF